MIRFTKYFAFLSCLLLFSCAKKLVGENLEKVERRKTSDLLDVLGQSYETKATNFLFQDFHQIPGYDTGPFVQNVDPPRKRQRDHALITYATLPIFNSILTPDSLTILNKRGKCFTKTKLNYIKENFGVAFDYKNVEELLLGLPLAYDDDQKYFQIHDPYNYIISSHRKREIRRFDKKEKLQDDISIKYFLSNDLKGPEENGG